MLFIDLHTAGEGNTIHVNVDNVARFQGGSLGTDILLVDQSVCDSCVRETPEEILQLINTARQEQNPQLKEKDAMIAKLVKALKEAEATIESDIDECLGFWEGYGNDECTKCERYKECYRWPTIRKVRSALAKGENNESHP